MLDHFTVIFYSQMFKLSSSLYGFLSTKYQEGTTPYQPIASFCIVPSLIQVESRYQLSVSVAGVKQPPDLKYV